MAGLSAAYYLLERGHECLIFDLGDRAGGIMRDLPAHGVEMMTIGQYLAPSGHHLPVVRYVHPDTFKMFETEALKMGFTGAACGPMVRSSYWADKQAHNAGVA